MDQVAADPITLVYHELRAPLGLMATAARSGAEDCSDEALRDRFETIVRVAERMLRTASRVMEIANVKRCAEREEFVPAEVVRNVVSDLQGVGMEICLELGGPEVTRAIVAVPGHLEALIASLLMNASDHAERGTAIVVQVAAAESLFAVEIRNAIGAETRHRGLGLGRYICSQLTELAGATLDWRSDGSTFTSVVRLPLHTPAYVSAS